MLLSQASIWVFIYKIADVVCDIALVFDAAVGGFAGGYGC